MIIRRFKLFSSIFLVLLCVLFVNAQSTLEVDTVTTCDNAQGILLSRFDIRYFRENETVFVDIAGINNMGTFNGTAHLIAYAAGVQIYSLDVPLCSINISQVCPIPSGLFEATTSVPAPPQLQNDIPSFVFNLPQVATSVKLSVTMDTPQPSGSAPTQADLCVVAQFGNGKSLNIPAIGWTSAGFAIAAAAAGVFRVLTAAITGDVNKALSASYPSLTDIVMFSQHIAFIGQMSLDYPKFYQQFTLNFAWSTGLVHLDFVENAITSARKKFGGFIDQYPLDSMKIHFNPVDFHAVEYILIPNAVVSPPNTTTPHNITSIPTNTTTSHNITSIPTNITSLAPNITNHAPNITSITPNITGITNSSITNANLTSINSTYITTPQNTTLIGLDAYVKELEIPTANVFMTVLLVFVLVLALLTAMMLIGYLLLRIFLSKLPKVKEFVTKYPHLYVGFSLRLVAMAYSFLITYSLFQFTLRDSILCLVCAGITVGILFLLLLVTSFQVIRAGHENLFHDEKYLYRYGFLYKEYREKAFIYFIPVILYTALKACLVGLAQNNAWVQAIGSMAAEGFLFVMLLVLRPFKTTKENFLSIFVSFFQTAAAVLVFFFVGPLQVDVEKKTTIGIILLALQSLIALILYAVVLYQVIDAIREFIKKRKEAKEKREKEKEKEKNGHNEEKGEKKDDDVEKAGNTTDKVESGEVEVKRPFSSKPSSRQSNLPTAERPHPAAKTEPGTESNSSHAHRPSITPQATTERSNSQMPPPYRPSLAPQPTAQQTGKTEPETPGSNRSHSSHKPPPRRSSLTVADRQRPQSELPVSSLRKEVQNGDSENNDDLE